jgi:ABC-2 type transport system ATP-binding protein
MPMIQLKGVKYGYSKSENLFQNMDLEIKEGNIVGLLGKNGAGKSSLLRLINGLLKAQQGDVSVFGYNPFDRSPFFLQNVMMIPEEYNLPDKTTMEKYASSLAMFYPHFEKTKFQSLLRNFELDSSKKFGKCSYGQRKKFMITFALSTGCKLLLLDEPTNGLDIPSKSIFRKMVAGNLNPDQTVVISTHQVKDVENLIDRVILVDQGHIVLDQDMLTISDRYSFGFSTQQSDAWIYAEKAQGGYHYFEELPPGENPTQVNLELFFNAVAQGKVLFQSTQNQAVS